MRALAATVHRGQLPRECASLPNVITIIIIIIITIMEI